MKSTFYEKREWVVLTGSELLNTQYCGINDTPTKKAYQINNGLTDTPQ